MRPAPSDTVPAMLTPGEAVLNKEAAELVGRDKIKQINKMGMHMRKAQGYADGDPNVQPATSSATSRLAGMKGYSASGPAERVASPVTANAYMQREAKPIAATTPMGASYRDRAVAQGLMSNEMPSALKPVATGSTLNVHLGDDSGQPVVSAMERWSNKLQAQADRDAIIPTVLNGTQDAPYPHYGPQKSFGEQAAGMMRPRQPQIDLLGQYKSAVGLANGTEMVQGYVNGTSLADNPVLQGMKQRMLYPEAFQPGTPNQTHGWDVNVDPRPSVQPRGSIAPGRGMHPVSPVSYNAPEWPTSAGSQPSAAYTAAANRAGGAGAPPPNVGVGANRPVPMNRSLVAAGENGAYGRPASNIADAPPLPKSSGVRAVKPEIGGMPGRLAKLVDWPAVGKAATHLGGALESGFALRDMQELTPMQRGARVAEGLLRMGGAVGGGTLGTVAGPAGSIAGSVAGSYAPEAARDLYGAVAGEKVQLPSEIAAASRQARADRWALRDVAIKQAEEEQAAEAAMPKDVGGRLATDMDSLMQQKYQGMKTPAQQPSPVAPAPQAEEQLTGNRVIPAGMRLTSYGAVTPINNPLAYEAERRMVARDSAAQMAPINALIQQAMNPSADDGTFTGMGRAKRQASGARAALSELAGMQKAQMGAEAASADRAANREVTMRGQDITAANAAEVNKRQLIGDLISRDLGMQRLNVDTDRIKAIRERLAQEQAMADAEQERQMLEGLAAQKAFKAGTEPVLPFSSRSPEDEAIAESLLYTKNPTQYITARAK